MDSEAAPPDSQHDLAPHDKRLVALLACWRAIRDGEPVPRKRRFDPISVPDILPHIYLWSYDWRSNDFLFRLAGEQILAMFAREPRPGAAIADCLSTSFVDTIRQRYLRIVRNRVILYDRGTVRTSEDKTVSAERIVLPLSDDGASVTHIVGATIYGDSTAGSFISEESEELVFAPV